MAHSRGPFRKESALKPATNDTPAIDVTRALPRTNNLSLSKQKRSQVKVACAACRRSKSKCDGRTPSYSRCASRGAACDYETEPNVPRSVSLRRQSNTLQEEVNLLRKLNKSMRECSEAEAVNLLRQLRAGTEPSEVLRSFVKGRGTAGTLDGILATLNTFVDDKALDLDQSGIANESQSSGTIVHDDLLADAT